MTPEEQRVAIAEACGFSDGRMDCTQLPDYINDLNAMHKAEKNLTMPQIETFGKLLCGFTDRADMVPYTRQWHATAAQRAEAFLRTTERWKV